VKHWCLAVAVLMLAGCAATGGGEYRRGTPAPVAPPFNPATDAPHTVGQPGHLRPQTLPRSPHTRELPPPGDWPGLYSGDRPEAGMHDYDEGPGSGTLLGTGWPPAPVDSEFVHKMYIMCADELQASADGAGGTERALKLNTDEQFCLVYHLMFTCMDRRYRAAAEPGTTLPAEPLAKLKAARDTLDRTLNQLQCRKRTPSAEYTSFYGRIISNWRAVTND
jgi:hypothetical protein